MKDIEYYREQIIKGLRGSGFLIPGRYATIIRLQRRHRRRLVFHLLDMFLMFHCSFTQHFLTANPLLTPVHWGATFHQVASHLFYDCTQLNNTRWEWWRAFEFLALDPFLREDRWDILVLFTRAQLWFYDTCSLFLQNDSVMIGYNCSSIKTRLSGQQALWLTASLVSYLKECLFARKLQQISCKNLSVDLWIKIVKI